MLNDYILCSMCRRAPIPSARLEEGDQEAVSSTAILHLCTQDESAVNYMKIWQHHWLGQGLQTSSWATLRLKWGDVLQTAFFISYFAQTSKCTTYFISQIYVNSGSSTRVVKRNDVIVVLPQMVCIISIDNSTCSILTNGTEVEPQRSLVVAKSRSRALQPRRVKPSSLASHTSWTFPSSSSYT